MEVELLPESRAVMAVGGRGAGDSAGMTICMDEAVLVKVALSPDTGEIPRTGAHPRQ